MNIVRYSKCIPLFNSLYQRFEFSLRCDFLGFIYQLLLLFFFYISHAYIFLNLLLTLD